MTFREFAENYDEMHGPDVAVNARHARLWCGERLFRKRSRAHVLRVTPHRAFNLQDEQLAYACVLLDTPWRVEDELMAGGSAVAALRTRWDMLSANLRTQYEHQQTAAVEDGSDSSDDDEDEENTTGNRARENDADDNDDAFEFDDEHERLAQMASDMHDAQEMREESMRNAQSTATARTPGVRFVDEETRAARRAFLDQVDAENNAHRDAHRHAYMYDDTFRALRRAELNDAVQRFRGKQREVYDYITAHLADLSQPPIRTVVSGEAGTGNLTSSRRSSSSPT